METRQCTTLMKLLLLCCPFGKINTLARYRLLVSELVLGFILFAVGSIACKSLLFIYELLNFFTLHIFKCVLIASISEKNLAKIIFVCFGILGDLIAMLFAVGQFCLKSLDEVNQQKAE